MLSNAGADADLVRIKPRAKLGDRNAPRAMVWLDHRSVREGPVLHFAGGYGGLDVFGFEDDANDQHRSAATDDDEIHAAFFCRYVHYFPDFERTCRVHFNQQPGGHRATMVFESYASRDCSGESEPRQQEILSHDAQPS